MVFLTYLFAGLIAFSDTLSVGDSAVAQVADTIKTIDLTGTVIVNAEFANQSVAPVRTSEASVVDTLDTSDEHVKILLHSDKTWRFVKLEGCAKTKASFDEFWDAYSVNPYQIEKEKLPEEWAIWLVDSLDQFHYPYKGAIRSGGKYGPRNSRAHQGVDLPLPVGAPIYATFAGKVRISKYSDKGYGHYIVIRHDNGLETFYAHLSARKVEAGDWVNAGQVIGLGGSTGRSTGPHLHYEVRYQGFSFDPEWIIDFKTGVLKHRLFILKKKYFGVNHATPQDFETEAKADKAEAEKKAAAEAAKKAVAVWHTVVAGDTLYALAVRNKTTVSAICKLNGITETTTLALGRKLRIK